MVIAKDLKVCEHCGRELVEISTKSADYKGVCVGCEVTYKVVNGVRSVKTSTAHQLVEATIKA